MSDNLKLNRRNLMFGVSGGAAALALGACSRTDSNGGGDGDGGSLLERAQDGETIRVAYADEAPYAYTAEDGSVVGQSVDTHVHILEQLGISADQIDWQLTEWGSLIPGLGGTHDMVIAGMYVTPDRCENVAFANPDYIMPDALLVLAGNPGGYTTLNEMADTDGVIGVMNGTSEQEIADQIYPEDRINVQGDLDSLILELKAGRLDAIALTSANLQLAADADDEIETTEGFWPKDPETGEDIIGAGAAVFQPGDTDFRDAVNDEVAKLLDDTETWESIVGEYGFTVETNHPEGLTAEELCPDTYQ
ncbi:transporter substrate-binding domain-containing protein [Glycomyces xiaoerkulensis]|uniref:transporter substrate-binding domain-containing protein n=1 Tax=Glycomyces xiaoerkulensis TaxID=2038139 RepID=UPI0012FFDBF9|nr:transporter substrate-binding domain-containing protein [Glycomyces xiaoerkulensis]